MYKHLTDRSVTALMAVYQLLYKLEVKKTPHWETTEVVKYLIKMELIKKYGVLLSEPRSTD